MLKTKYNTDKTELENKIPDISNLATKTALTTVENKILLKKQIITLKYQFLMVKLLKSILI